MTSSLRLPGDCLRRLHGACRIAAAGVASVALLAGDGSFASARSRNTLPVPQTFAQADSLVIAFAPSPERLAAFRSWTRSASLDDLMYVLRRETAVLDALEAPALEAAISRVPAERAELRERLSKRLLAVAPRRGKHGETDAVGGDANAPHSVFRVALLLPARGEQAEDAAEIALGFRLGVTSVGVGSRPPIEFVTATTANEDPAAVAAAFDSVQRGVALVCGGFTLVSAQLLAAASRWSGLPVLLPDLDDAVASRVSSRTWSVGPAAAERGRALAEAMKIGASDRVAAITSSAADTAFGGAFAAACRARGAAFVARFGYAAGNATFAAETRALQTQRVTVLFWDGDPSEAAPLLRQLTRDRVSLRICGGDGFDPARHHRETRVFLEGVRYAGPDWVLGPTAGAQLKQAMDSVGAGPASALHVRGWLAGRVAGQALASGPLTPGELAAALARLSGGETSPVRLLDVRSTGAELPVFTVSDGRAAPAQ